MDTYIQVKQVRSCIGRPESQRVIIKGLGLRGMNQTVKLQDTPAIRGMVRKVQHLLEVKVYEGKAELFGRRAKK